MKTRPPGHSPGGFFLGRPDSWLRERQGDIGTLCSRMRVMPGRCLFVLILALAAGSCGCRRTTPAEQPTPVAAAPAAGWFTEVTTESGLAFEHTASSTGMPMPAIMGPGAALFDFDNDGDLDAYLMNGGDPFDGPTSNSVPNRLFRQDQGRFVDVTASSGLGDRGFGMGAAVGDIDNDGAVDVYVTNFGPDALYRNRGDGTFENITLSAGLDVPEWSCSAVMFDYDRDGFLDIFVTQYVDVVRETVCRNLSGLLDFCGPKSFAPRHDVLLHNDGSGRFRDVSKECGLHTAPPAAGLGVVSADFNGDGWADVYVANDAYMNNMWINQQDGTFADEGLMLGVACNALGQTEAGMGIALGDFDNDARSDLLVTHLADETNTLYHNLGDGRGFIDYTGQSRLAASSMTRTGFGTAAFDVELDGDLDLAIVNGRVVTVGEPLSSSLSAPWNRYPEPNLFYINNGSGQFAVFDPGAQFTRRVEIGRGLAAGDIDNDGDIDLLMTNCHGPARLYRNDAPRQGHWLSIRLRDPRFKRDAIGAEVTVKAGALRQVRTVGSGGSYLSVADTRVHFGLGSMMTYDRIDVRWPDGLRESFSSGTGDRMIELNRGTGEMQP